MFDNPFSMVVAIVLIVSIAGVLRAKYGVLRDRHGNERPLRDPEADRLQAELKALKDRVAVLERIATDDSSKLDREIEALRDRH
jgi:hypothetical protein